MVFSRDNNYHLELTLETCTYLQGLAEVLPQLVACRTRKWLTCQIHLTGESYGDNPSDEGIPYRDLVKCCRVPENIKERERERKCSAQLVLLRQYNPLTYVSLRVAYYVLLYPRYISEISVAESRSEF